MASGDAPVPENSSNEAQFSAKKSSTDLLRHVLEETLAAGSNAMTSLEWEKMQAVARTHLADELDMHQVAEMLVAALLATRFPNLPGADANQRMVQRIANSLCEDPESMQRLKNFWNQLRASIA